MATKSTAKQLSDERLKVGGHNERSDRGFETDPERGDAGLMSDDDYEKFLEDEFDQTALPQPPLLPGWHLCWLTTTSKYDSLQKRARLGYAPVRQSEMPGFDASNGSAIASDDGPITCNEMILCKIEERRYQSVMRHFHHKKPLEAEEAIVRNKPEGGISVAEPGEDGLEELSTRVREERLKNPVF